LSALSPGERKVTAELLGYEPETAGRLMTTEFIDLKEMQSLCLNVEILSAGEEISMKDISDEYVKTAETLGIDMTRPEQDEAEV